MKENIAKIVSVFFVIGFVFAVKIYFASPGDVVVPEHVKIAMYKRANIKSCENEAVGNSAISDKTKVNAYCTCAVDFMTKNKSYEDLVKLEKALLSGDPNTMDFAFSAVNACKAQLN